MMGDLLFDTFGMRIWLQSKQMFDHLAGLTLGARRVLSALEGAERGCGIDRLVMWSTEKNQMEMTLVCISLGAGCAYSIRMQSYPERAPGTRAAARAERPGRSPMRTTRATTVQTLVKTAIFSILVPGTVAFVIPWLLLQQSGGTVFVTPSPWLIGLLPLGVGVGLYLWCAGAFTFIGHGTPAPIDAPTILVAQGVYRWVRNPMYVAVLSIVVGEATLLRSLLLAGYALLLWAIFHAFVIAVEEPSLRRQFGASYETYLRTVPRWLPRPPRA
jgi:protein-S-isoprenylcysteine O-methyltransferase Ste14